MDIWAKIMELKEIKRIKAKNQLKIIRGDFITLGKCLKISSNSATKRYSRNNEKAVLTMQTIIKSRENVVKEFQKK